MPQSYQAILFDLDNTLLDFTHSEHVSLGHLHEHHFSEHIDDNFADFKQNYKEINHSLWEQVHLGELVPAEVKHQRFFELCQYYQIEHDIEMLSDHYESQLGCNAPWYPGVKEALEQLRNHYKIGIVTNGLSKVQRAKYETSGLDQWCECFIVSDEVGIAKPDKAIFDIAFKQLDCRPEHTLMVGDSLEGDFQGAINAGMDFCWITAKPRALTPEPAYTLTSVTKLMDLLPELA